MLIGTSFCSSDRAHEDVSDTQEVFQLGERYRIGEGVPQDHVEAGKWYRLAAERGHAEAQVKLGIMYAEGLGVPENDSEAVEWFRLAAAQGHAGGQNNLGVMYARGEGVPEDDLEALKWYRLAAAQGDAHGQNNLGVRYSMRPGRPSQWLAHMWLNLAGANGHHGARKARSDLEDDMSEDDILRAQQMARDCHESNYRNCGH